MFRLGLIGAGRMGQTHLRALRSSDKVRISAVADPRQLTRDQVASPGVSGFPDVTAMIASRCVDGVLVAAPTDLHLAIVGECADAGLPVLCEKPCGLTAEAARQASAVTKRASCVLQVAYWRRFVPALQQVRARIVDRAYGDLYFISCYQWDVSPPAAEFRLRSGGIFVDMGVHEFDQLRWLSGQDIVRVQAAAASAGEGAPVAGDVENAQALCTLAGGAVGLVSLGRRYPLGDVCWVELFGTRHAEESRFLWPPDSDATFEEALRLQAEAFVDRVADGGGSGATAQDAVAALEAAQWATQTLHQRE